MFFEGLILSIFTSTDICEKRPKNNAKTMQKQCKNIAKTIKNERFVIGFLYFLGLKLLKV